MGRVWTDKEAWVGWNLKISDQVFGQILKASKVIITVGFSCNYVDPGAVEALEASG